MAKSNISDIDYDVFNVTSVDEKPAEPQKQKSAGISQRSISKAKASEKADANMRDLTGASDPTEIANRATETSNALPNPEVPDALANYALPGLGALGTGLAAYGLWKNKDKMTWDKSVGGAPPEGMTQKTDLRDIQPAPAPAAQELPKPQFPQGNVQQPAVSGYGQQTINAPTGAPNVAAPAAPVAPPAEAAPQPVDPLQEARIRKANAEAAIAEHKLHQLQSGATQKSSGKAPAAASESEMQMIQKGGAASVSQRQAGELKEFEAQLPKPQEAIQASANPVEKQAAVAAVEKTISEPKPISGEAGKAVYPTQKTFKTAADIPEGFVFRPDVGNLDRSMGNILGKEHREYAREMFSGGKPFGHSTDVNKDVSRLTTEYFQRLQQEVPETILSREARKAQNIPSEFGTFAKNTNFGKAAKVAGVAGTLLAVADLANAKTAEQKATAGTNLLGSVLPPFMDINDVGAPGVSAKQLENAYKLGSPFAQTEEAKRYRQGEKVGAGRGIAPPSSYQR